MKSTELIKPLLMNYDSCDIPEENDCPRENALNLLDDTISRCRSSFSLKFCLDHFFDDIVGQTTFDRVSTCAEVVDKSKLILVSKMNDYCAKLKNEKLMNKNIVQNGKVEGIYYDCNENENEYRVDIDNSASVSNKNARSLSTTIF